MRGPGTGPRVPYGPWVHVILERRFLGGMVIYTGMPGLGGEGMMIYSGMEFIGVFGVWGGEGRGGV